MNDNEDLSEYVLERLKQAREKALAKYKEVWESKILELPVW